MGISSSILNGLLMGGIYALMALGLVLIYGVMRMINLALGPLIVLAGFITFSLSSWLQIDPLFLLPLLFILFAGLGILVYWILLKPVVFAPRMVTLILLMGLGYVIENLTLNIWGPDYRSIVTTYSSKSITLCGISISFLRLITFLISALTLIVIYIILNKTKVGKAMRACAQNLRGAQIVGIDLDRIFSLTTALSFGIYGIAGVVISMIIVMYPAAGSLFTLKSFCINVLGGLGSVIGIPVASIIVGVTESISSNFLPVILKEGVAFLFLVLVLLVKPSGLFGKFQE